MPRNLFLFFLLIILACRPAPSEKADLIIINGVVVTMDEAMPDGEAVAVKDGRILAVGEQLKVMPFLGDSTKIIDAGGHFVMPGFIESHGHFSGLGSSLQNLNFLRSRSWDEIVDMVGEKVKQSAPGEWIVGRGWHQEKWVRVP